jgi:hypothetical protein
VSGHNHSQLSMMVLSLLIRLNGKQVKLAGLLLG